MTRTCSRAASIVAAGVLLCASPALCRAQARAEETSTSSDENTRLQALFREGISAYEAGNDEASLKALSEAWAIRPTYDIAAAIAQTELALERYRDAAEHLDYGLAHFVPGQSEKTLEVMRTAFAEVKQHVAALNVQVNEEGATLELNDRALGISPLPRPVFVEPGRHTLRARHGDRRASRQLDVQAGRAYPVRLEFASAHHTPVGAFAETPSPSPSSSSADAGHERSLTPVVIGATVAAIGAAGFVTFGALASSDADTMQQLREKNGAYGCSDGTAAASDCAAQHDAAISHDRHRNLAIAGAIVGAVGLVSIPVYWFWPRAQSSPGAKAASRLEMHGAVGVGSVSLFGQF